MEKQEKLLHFQGKSVYFSTEGEGRAVVLLHGFMESKSMWSNFSARLSKKFRVISIDLPGHGKTGSYGEVHTMNLMAGVVAAVLDSENIERCVMAGHSMGGYVTAEFAALFPERLLGMGFIHSQVSSDNDDALKNRDKTIGLVKKYKESFIRNFIPDLFAPENVDLFHSEIDQLISDAVKMDTNAIVAALQGMKGRSGHEEMLGKALFPVLFISGKKDVKIPAEKILYQGSLPKHCEILMLDNTGHMGHLEARQKTLSFLESFCDRIFNQNQDA